MATVSPLVVKLEASADGKTWHEVPVAPAGPTGAAVEMSGYRVVHVFGAEELNQMIQQSEAEKGSRQ